MLSLLVAGLFLGAAATIPDPKDLDKALWTDLVDRWFPACVDPKGGFRQNFDKDFVSQDDGARGLVFQSRMIWVCATLAGQNPKFKAYAHHGVQFLKDHMDGGLTWSLDKEGQPTATERHAYGISFAIYGLAATARHLKDKEALELANRAFRFLEEHHHDAQNGGYYEATDAQGNPKLTGVGGDSIGTPYGQKSQNTHLHLLEAFTELYRAGHDPLVKKRLAETLGLFTKQLFAEPGHLTLFVQPDWTPVSHETSFGHDVEAAHLMLDAADALGDHDPLILKRARQLIDNALKNGWDHEHGGIYYTDKDKSKIWWAEAEALLGFATLWTRTHEPRYSQALADEWAFIKAHQIDPEHGGWYEDADKRDMPKGHAWKAAYHDGRALLFTARLLRTGDKPRSRGQ
jgi:mannobiose 2-epimerase